MVIAGSGIFGSTDGSTVATVSVGAGSTLLFGDFLTTGRGGVISRGAGLAGVGVSMTTRSVTNNTVGGDGGPAGARLSAP